MQNRNQTTHLLRFSAVIIGILGVLLSNDLAAADSPSQKIKLNTLSPLASASELTSRLLTPVTQDRIAKFREKVNFSLKEQTIAVGEEPFELFVPEPDADGKYGLMVFVWPADDIQVPAGWWKVLRDKHMIYVASRRSSNIENIFDRRVPLALHGYEYVRSRYNVDIERVYIGGFSGGSRTAQRVAMAYPDVFRGVFLVGGSDTLGGDSGFTLPSAQLSRVLQERTRFVFSTGGDDSVNRAKDARTRKNLEALCMQGVRVVPQNGVEHWVPDGRGFSRVLNELDRPVPENVEAAACNVNLIQSIDEELGAAARKINDGELKEAGLLLGQLDARYGGMAAPRSVELSRTIADKAGLYEVP
ncbi:MAG TPA: PHB depolymerase family esterase [Pseudoxanthomonas sp.]